MISSAAYYAFPGCLAIFSPTRRLQRFPHKVEPFKVDSIRLLLICVARFVHKIN